MTKGGLGIHESGWRTVRERGRVGGGETGSREDARSRREIVS